MIELTDRNQKLRVLGDALAKLNEVIAAIVEIYVMSANTILAALEVQETKTEPILSSNFLSDLMQQLMSIDLSDMMEDLFRLKEPEPQTLAPASWSIITPLHNKAAHAIAPGARIDAKRMLVAVWECHCCVLHFW